MIHKNQRIINLLNILSDVCLIFLSFPLAAYLRFGIMDGIWDFGLSPALLFLIPVLYSIGTVLTYLCLRMYGSFRFKSAGSEAAVILLVNGIFALGLLACFYLFRIPNFSRLMLFFIWFFPSFLILSKRWIIRKLLQHYRALGYNKKHVILVGSGSLAENLVRDVKKNPQFGLIFDGYIGSRKNDLLGNYLGDYSKIEDILNQHYLDELVIALGAEEATYVKKVLKAADKEGVRITMVPFYNDYYPAHPTIDVLGDTKLINLRSSPLDNIGFKMLKRSFDIVASLLLILLTSPVMLIVAIGVKCSSPGPILFRQTRVGLNKKEFEMLKFRSMRISGKENTAWSTNEDPRKTKFGSFIRKCSLDELPQFFNVLKGDMSLVGPRPEIPYHVSHFKEEIPLYMVRHQARPGITGWAQVNGFRGDTSIAERVKYDIWYIQNWSIGLDIKILFKTAFGGMVNNEVICVAKNDDSSQQDTAETNAKDTDMHS